MMLRKTMAVLAAAAMVALSPPAVAAPQTPASFLDHAYAPYRSKDGDTRPGPDARLFGGELLRLLREDARAAKGEVGVVDGDLLCDCQDWGDVSYAIAVTGQTMQTARARVVFKSLGSARTSDLDLVRTPVGWRIVDIHRNDTPSVVAWLRHELGAQKR